MEQVREKENESNQKRYWVAWVEQSDSSWDDPDVRRQSYWRLLSSRRELTLVELERETASAGQIVLHFIDDAPAKLSKRLSKSVIHLLLHEMQEGSLKSLRLSEMRSLKHLWVEGSWSGSDELNQCLSTLTDLVSLRLWNCNLTKIPESIAKMTSLKELDLYNNNLSKDDQLGQTLSALTNLEILNLSRCQLTKIPESIAKMTSLRWLDLGGNDLSNDNQLGQTLSALTNLEILDLRSCKLTKIPDSISKMVSLKELNVSDNNLSTDDQLNDTLSGLKRLEKLDMSGCHLVELPSGIAKMVLLKELNGNGNDLSTDDQLGDKLSGLTRLEKLSMIECQLVQLPSGIRNMEFLRVLDIGKNKLIELPSWIGQVKSLTNFSVAGTLSLTKLDSSIASLAHLERLNCSDCFNLIEPPYAVCEGGLSDVRQYYKDLGDDKTPMILSTVILVGKKHAGKSTLLSAMSNGFAAKSKSDKRVEKTKVFEITPVDLRGSGSHQSTVNVIDFGGDEEYQYAYRLTFCKDCIPIVVVDIEEYENLAIEFGMREATRRVAFDWLSHIITICPEVQEPILVSTHRDRYQDEKKYNDLCEQLKKTVKNLTGELLHGTDRSKTLTMFKDSSVTSCVFKKDDVFSAGFVSSDERYCKELKRLEERLYERVEQSKGVIPAIWQQIIALVDGEKEKSHLILKDLLDDQQRKSTVTAVLSFMKKSGRILYYPAVGYSFHGDAVVGFSFHGDILNDKVFHNMPALTELISSLYDHNMKREIVVGATTTDQAFTKHNSYLMNGVMSSQDLRNLISGDTGQMPFDISIALLKKFKLLHGPVTINSKRNWYLIPYFMPKHNFAVKAGEVSLQATLNFVGLKVPDYAFHQMTVAFLEHMAGRCYQVFPYGNGASTKIHTESDSGENELDITMIHDTDGQRIVVRAEGYATTVHTVWKEFCSLIQRLSKESKSAWPATQIAYEILCPHCLVLDKANPALINHKRITDDSSQGMQDVSSSSCSGETDIPYQLRRPCREQSASEIKSLRKYITDKGPNESELMKEIVKNQEPDIKLQAVHQNNLYSSSAMERVYRMTPTRGRALIINTGSQADRKGSQHDYTNVEHTFEQFGFIISNLSADKDWKAKEVIEAIHEETQYVDSNGTSIHAHMGMFVLVLMSHGGYGTIGVDGCILKLVDIYRLLSPQNFPAMRGKPKMIILQSCSGETRMIKDDSLVNQAGGVDEIHGTSSNKRGYDQEEEESCKRRKSEVRSNIGSDARVPGSNIREDSHLCMDDLIVFHPSFPDYVAYRSDTKGSIFIRALVTTFCRQAGRQHAEQLSKTAKLQIGIYAKKLPTPDEPQYPPCHCSLVIQTLVREVAPELDGGQLPVTISTFTNERKLYLSPGVNMRTKDEHPRELLANPITPNPAKTEIIFKERDELINNKRVSLLKFDVKKLPTADQR